jgi:glutathione S-transferase
MPAIEIFGFETSNNMKVRIALNYKDLDFVFHPVDPADRAQIVSLTGQPLTPVLRHGEVLLFDSGAILRYLDANFPAAPRLFAGDRKTLVAIEFWETFGRARLLAPLITVVNHRLQGGQDPAVFAAAQTDFLGAVEELTPALQGRAWLVGDTMTGADVTTAPVVFRALGYGFGDTADLAPDVRAWAERVMAYDTPTAT